MANGDIVRSDKVSGLRALVETTTAAGDPAYAETVASPTLPAAAWAADSTAQDTRSYPNAELQVSGLSGGDTIAVTRSIDGTNYVPVSWVDQAFAVGPTISADGIYGFPGGGYLKWTKAGSASTPTVTLRAGN